MPQAPRPNRPPSTACTTGCAPLQEHDLQREMAALCTRHGVDQAAICRDLCMPWDELKSFAAIRSLRSARAPSPPATSARQQARRTGEGRACARPRTDRGQAATPGPASRLSLWRPGPPRARANSRLPALPATDTALTTRPGMLFARKRRPSPPPAPAGLTQRQLPGRARPVCDEPHERRPANVERFPPGRRGVTVRACAGHRTGFPLPPFVRGEREP